MCVCVGVCPPPPAAAAAACTERRGRAGARARTPGRDGTVIIYAVEMILAGHAGNVVLRRNECQHARWYGRNMA